MRYAILSDIHGNLGALASALAAIERERFDAILLLGDYIIDFPSANEVLDRMRALPNARAIRGNKEGYLLSLEGIDPALWCSEQYAPTVACYRSLTPSNIDYLRAMPDALTIDDPHVGAISMRHALEQRLGAGRIPQMHSREFCLRWQRGAPYGPEAYLRDLQAAFAPGTAAYEGMCALPEGLYLAGHNHLQGHVRLPGRAHINPGSCGMPLDGDVRPAYSVLTTFPGGWTVEERRAAPDVAYEREALRALCDVSPVWSGIVAASRRLALDRFSSMFTIVQGISDAPGSIEHPHRDEDWRRAYALWRAEMGEE